jgi:hypothetical protein
MFRFTTKNLLALGLAVLALPLLVAAKQAVGEPCDPATACFDVALSPAALVGDFYVDGVLVAQGVNSARLTGAPDVDHFVEVRNLQEPGVAGFGDLYVYADQSAVQQTHAGWIWRLYFYPPRVYVKGTFTYTCLPRGYRATDSVACRPTLDGVTMPDVAPGARAVYTLTPGDHAVHTDLVGDSANNWSMTARDDVVNVVGGRFAYLTSSFPLKGLLKISVFPNTIVADIYVNGVLIAAQSAAAELFVPAAQVNTIEARNVADPAANGNWKHNDATQTAIAYEGGTRYIYLRPVKVWLTGKLSLYCYLSRFTTTDDAACLVSADGVQLGAVAHGTRSVFTLPTGAHIVDVSVTGASAGRWAGPISFTQNIIGGGTSYYTARFNLIPSVPPPPPVTNPPPVTGGGGGSTPGGFELGGQVAGFDRPDLMKFAGMMWVKRQVRWHPGDRANADLINDAHAKGFKILVSVLGEPSSIAGGANHDDYARFVGELAALGADGIEVWNEMNIDREWPTGEIDPAKYTDLLRRAYQKIKANNPNTLVISGAPAPTGAEGAFGRDRVWNDDAYVAGMAAAGAGAYMDCIGAHYNEGILSPTLDSGDPRDPYYTRYYSGMVVTYFNAFGRSKKICFTELGYLTPEGYGPLPSAFGWAGNTTVAQQAQWLAEAVSLARSSSSVRMIIVFNVDLTSYGDDPQAGYAIIRPGGVCPACDSLHNVTGGR